MTALANPFAVKAIGGTGLQCPDLDEVRRALQLLVHPHYHTMIMALPVEGRVSWIHCVGDDYDGLIDAVKRLAGRKGCYVLQNAACPDVPFNQRIKGEHIVRRTHVVIDIDRCDKAETASLNATDAEVFEIHDLAIKIIDYLRLQGWPEPLLIDSGNGRHIDYCTDLPNDQESKDAINTFLKTLSLRFSTKKYQVDKSMFDAARMRKLPGTWARKGKDASDRPQRLCKILVTPDGYGSEILTLEQIQAVNINLLDAKQADNPFLIYAQPDLKEAYLQRILDGEVAKLVGTGPGDRHHALYKSAANFGNLVAGGYLSFERAEELLMAASAGWKGERDKDQRTIADGLKKGMETPRVLPESNNKASAPNPQPISPEQALQQYPIYSLPEILAMQLPPKKWAIYGLIPEGLSMLLGAPKQGKSFFALNLALTVAAGGRALGEIDVEPGDVLYLALEDQLRRIQDRSVKLLSGLSVEPPGRLYFAVDSPKLDEGGIDFLEGWIKKSDCPRMIIIDVWAKFKSKPASTGNAYENDYQVIGPVKKLADKHGVAVVLIHHTKKESTADWVHSSSGTTGTPGAADGLLALQRLRGENEAKLLVTGRDFEEQEIAVEFNPDNFIWTMMDRSSPGRKPKRQRSAQEFLLAKFADTDHIPALDLIKDAEQHEISKSGLKEAKEVMGITSKKIGLVWHWFWAAVAKDNYLTELRKQQATLDSNTIEF
jgi:hypothetical protein